MIATARVAYRRGDTVDIGDGVAAALGAVFGGSGTAAIVTALVRRRVTRVEAADQLTESAIELLNTVKADARADLVAMRTELTEARREAAETRAEIRRASADAEQLTGYLRRVVSAIHDPAMTMERLRVLVGNGPPNGGQPFNAWVSHSD